MVEVTNESSMKAYYRLLENPLPGPPVPIKALRKDPYAVDGKSVVTVVRCDDRMQGINEAVGLLGGMEPLVKGVDGEIVIKPNCNTDDPYPRDTHPDTIRAIAEGLMETGVSAGRIVVGDASGRGRGMPTRHTMANLGITSVAEELGIGLSYFEEEEWVTVEPPASLAWPNGIKIPRRIYEADRVILAPILRSHSTAVFTISLKLAVGLLDSVGREWLHDGRDFFPKQVELNLAYSADLIVADASRILIDRQLTPEKAASPGIIIASGNRVASDAVSVALMRLHGADRVSDKPTLEHEQFKVAERLGLGSPKRGEMKLKTLDLVGDHGFGDVVNWIEEELDA